jgi:hypothetical protein
MMMNWTKMLHSLRIVSHVPIDTVAGDKERAWMS